MKIAISFFGYGAECVAGYIPENIWKYIQDECGGDVDEYNEKLDSGEVPENLRLAPDSGEYFETDAKVFFNNYGPYNDACITVYDEDENKIAEFKLDNENIEIITSSKKPETKKPYFVWQSVEKGSWTANDSEYFEIDGEFDIKKLKVNLIRLNYDNNENYVSQIWGIEYDNVEYDISLDSTDGKGTECTFHEDSEED